MGNQILNLEEERCVPKIPIFIVILTGWGLGMCCPAAALGGYPIAWSGKDSKSTDVLTVLVGSKCPSAQILCEFGTMEKESGGGQTRGSL